MQVAQTCLVTLNDFVIPETITELEMHEQPHTWFDSTIKRDELDYLM